MTPQSSPRHQSPALLDVAGLAKSKSKSKSKSKPKQSQLAFASKVSADNVTKPKKPRKKPVITKPPNTINSAFTTTKSTKPAGVKYSKPAGLPTAIEYYSPYGNSTSSKLGLVSPSDHRTNSDPHSFPQSREFEVQIARKRTQLPSEIPETPPRDVSFDREATISPTSKPSGMENLIS